ncbi:HTTM domain-containing protein [Corynebacterium lactis]|uniref:HTTM domain-containing protein n=1 Tax=Corynebacterium lactis TaxID=1231000 RepID=UPI000B273A1C|nr:HTTM domain-containing protein [Corynebacterium lactis]
MIDALKGLQRVVQKPLQAPLEFAERASAFSQLLATLEGISPKERRFGGINDWDYTKYLFNSGGGISDAGVREIFVRCLATARIGASVVLLLPTGNNTRLVASSVSALSYLLGNRYTINGSDGAEQYSAIILASSALGRIDGGKNRDLAVDFIAAQTAFSYFVAGAVKSLGREWRNGTAVERVVRTEVYGNRIFYRFLRRNPRLSESLTYSTVVVEMLFPFLLLHRGMRKVALASMFAFHAANVPLMGLGRFFIVFTSTYPAVMNSTNRLKGRFSD